MKMEKSIIKKRIHCIGVKGIGLSALAQIYAGEGHSVSGSDIADPFPADFALRKAGIRILRGFSAKHITKNIDLIIASNAYLFGKPNAEVQRAKQLGIPVLSYPKALGRIFSQYQGIAVAGSHGKSTTSALLAVTLEALGRDPYAVIGAVVKNWNSNARAPKREATERNPFVIEADEYRRAFHHYPAAGAIITSIDWDHPDIFKTRASYRGAYVKFIRKMKKGAFLLVNGDDKEIATALRAAKIRPTLRYGHSVKNTLSIAAIAARHSGLSVTLKYRGKPLGEFETALFGAHHAMNIAAVVGTCLLMGERPHAIRRAMKRFSGTVRRFDIHTKKPYKEKPIVIDDYAHHPTEIAVTITAARAAFPNRRVRILFQPHTFSRTAAFFDEFVAAIETADDVALLSTYGSAREAAGGKSAKDLAEALDATYFATHASALRYYRKDLTAGDVLLIVGAGDGNLLAEKLTV